MSFSYSSPGWTSNTFLVSGGSNRIRLPRQPYCSSWLLRLLLLVVAALLPPVVDAAWIVRSENDNSWATGLGRYNALRRTFVVLTQFHDGTDDLTVAGRMDTDCRILIADASGQWKEILFENPQLCVGGTIVDQQRNDGVGIVVGIDGNRTTLLNIDGVGTDTPTPGSTFPLPQNKIPVATDAGDPTDGLVYVALHDIDDEPVFNGFGVDRASNLLGIMAYWRKFTDPLLLSQDQAGHVPHIVKLDPATGVVEWRGIYDLTHGSATIASMTYADYSLIVCGSTNGAGDAVGQNMTSDSNDWDGYVAFINPVTGNPDETFLDPDTEEVIKKSSVRIVSPTRGKQDFVHDMCLIGLNLYVVGTTEGTMSLETLNNAAGTNGGAFVVKIDVQRRIITNRIQLSGADRTGLKIVCKDDAVFVGGHVEFSDSTLDQQQNVYVTSYDAELSQMLWTVSIDTTPYFGGQPRLDELVDLEANPAGDINVLLNSQILSQGINDIIMMDLQGDSGAHEIQKGASAGNEGGIPDGGIEPEPVEDGQGTTGDNNMANQINTDTANENGDDEQKKRIILGVSITIPLMIALAVALYALSERRKQNALMVKPPTAAAAASAAQHTPEEAPQDVPALDSSDRNMV